MLGLTDDLAGPLLRQLDSSYTVRAVGRLIGDASVPPLFVIGWGLSLAPEQIRDISSGAPWEERMADAAVDSGNFLFGEGVGIVVGAITAPQAGPGAVGLKLASDVGAGFAYDVAADQFDWREKLTTKVGEISDEAMRTLAETTQRMLQQEAYRVPTPELAGPAAATPTPPAALEFPNAPATPSPDLAPVPPTAQETPKPSQSATPLP